MFSSSLFCCWSSVGINPRTTDGQIFFQKCSELHLRHFIHENRPRMTQRLPAINHPIFKKNQSPVEYISLLCFIPLRRTGPPNAQRGTDQNIPTSFAALYCIVRGAAYHQMTGVRVNMDITHRCPTIVTRPSFVGYNTPYSPNECMGCRLPDKVTSRSFQIDR